MVLRMPVRYIQQPAIRAPRTTSSGGEKARATTRYTDPERHVDRDEYALELSGVKPIETHAAMLSGFYGFGR